MDKITQILENYANTKKYVYISRIQSRTYMKMV